MRILLNFVLVCPNIGHASLNQVLEADEVSGECHGSLFYAHLNQVLKANEVSGESWLLVNASHGEGDGLTISKVMTALIVLAVLVCFAESDTTVIFK
jgi:hypothetical protein